MEDHVGTTPVDEQVADLVDEQQVMLGLRLEPSPSASFFPSVPTLAAAVVMKTR